MKTVYSHINFEQHPGFDSDDVWWKCMYTERGEYVGCVVYGPYSKQYQFCADDEFRFSASVLFDIADFVSQLNSEADVAEKVKEVDDG